MALTEAQIDDIAHTLVEQREAGTNVAFPDGVVPDQREVYSIQDRVTEQLGAGSPPTLFKVSWLPLALVDSPDRQPCFAGVPAGRIFASGVVIDGSRHVRRLGFEIEIACRLRVDSTGAATPGSAILGIEVIEEHSDDVGRHTIGALLAAGMFNHGYVLGPEVAGWPDLRNSRVHIWRNDEVASETTIGEQFDPNERLRRFLTHAAAVGWQVTDGMIVSLGALNKDVWATRGDRFVGEIEGFGRVSAEIG